MQKPTMVKDLGTGPWGSGARYRRALYQCICGAQFEASCGNVNSGRTTSCGCRQKAQSAVRRTTHGMSKTKVYQAWAAMVQRVTNPKHISATWYTHQGVAIEPAWLGDRGFETFYHHVGDPPSEKHSLDRIKNHIGYVPGNVKWSTAEEQSNNTSANVWLEFQGERRTLAQWAKHLGMSRLTLSYRLHKGLPVEKVLFKGHLKDFI